MPISKNQVIKILQRGGIGVLPTDTIYGLAGRALDKNAVSRIYAVKKRSPEKPLIVLISSLSDLKLFGVELNKKTGSILRKLWPGEVSIILPVKYKKFFYLHHGAKSLAFRLPAKTQLISILRQTGPLVAPSANPEGLPPAINIAEARKYFESSPFLPLRKGENKRRLDFYFGSGKLEAEPSTLIKIIDGKIEVLRQGSVVVQP